MAKIKRDKQVLSLRFSAEVKTIGNPDEDVSGLTTSGSSRTASRKKAIKLDTHLENLKAIRDQMIALGGEEEANQWEQMIQKVWRPKRKVTLGRVGKNRGGNL